MDKKNIPRNLLNLQQQEKQFQFEVLHSINESPDLALHVSLIERAMTLSRLLIMSPYEDDDFRIIKMLSIRVFNAFGASQLLLFSGYHQKSGMVMRDIIETVNLLDLFSSEPELIEQWRNADDRQRKKKFSPAAIRKILDKRDGDTSRKREKTYKMFSELAAHPNMHAQHMLKPYKSDQIITGPYMEGASLTAGLTEMARLARQYGEVVDRLLPQEWNQEESRESFRAANQEWQNRYDKTPEISDKKGVTQ